MCLHLTNQTYADRCTMCLIINTFKHNKLVLMPLQIKLKKSKIRQNFSLLFLICSNAKRFKNSNSIKK